MVDVFVVAGPKARVDGMVKSYYDGEYDFGIDQSIVMSLTGYEAEDAKELVAAMSKSEAGM
jgi:hypothetical protein